MSSHDQSNSCPNPFVAESPKAVAQSKIKLATKSPHAAYFMPMLQSFAKRNELNEVIKNRVSKSCELLDTNVSLYANGFEKSHSAAEVLQYSTMSDEDLANLGEQFICAGRIVSNRLMGKVAFFNILDITGRIQCYAARDVLGEESYGAFKKLDLGDIVGVKGTLFRTKAGELTLQCSELTLLTRSMRPLPDKWSGLKDVETRYRQRYVDLIATPRTREIFAKRSQIVREFRRFMEDKGFLEVETPMMQAVPGGATARPFVTHHNALDMQLYMRIAPELYLKRLLVGGFEKVFEINRNFRNEGISVRHNPEFTMCEFYWAYATFYDLMDLTEELFAHLAETVCGTTVIQYQGKEIDLTRGEWKRISFHDSLEVIGGHKKEFYNDYNALQGFIKSRGEKVVEGEKLAKLQAKLFDLDVEPRLIKPHFIYHYPTDISPLSRRNDKDPSITDRFELFIAGREIANAFSELNDPVDQRMRFEDQLLEKAAGDDEAHPMDEDYLRALEYGMPPAAGEGIGIDRLVMLLTDSASIREVILFPLLKHEVL